MTLSIDDPTLVVDQSELSSSHGEDIIIDAWQIVGGSGTGPTEGESLSSGANRDIQVWTSNSRFLQRRGENVAILGERSFPVELEEFEKLPLREQKRKTKKAMMNVW